MYNLHATFEIMILESFLGVCSYNLTEKMGHDGEMGLDLPIPRRVFPDLARLEGEDAEMVASAQNCGLHEGHFPGAWGPR